MINADEAIGYMIAELEQFRPKRRTAGGKQYAVRCPFCGDSVKHSTSTHFYIKTSPDAETGFALFSYQCKLCTVSGKIMNPETGEKLGLKSARLLDYMAFVKKSMRYAPKTVNSVLNTKNLDLSPKNDEFREAKIKYLKNRLGDTDVTNNPEKYKIVLNLRDFFVTNGLHPNTDYENPRRLLKTLHEKGIGTLSFDNTHIEFRDYTGTMAERYCHYSIYPKHSNEESHGLYIIPTTIDILSPQISIFMAEGVYDILRAFTDFNKCEKYNRIYAAVHNSHGYIPALKRMMRMGILPSKIVVFSDSDVELSFYKNVMKPEFPTAEFIVYYNTLSKDIGNINDPIKLRKFTI